MKHQAVLMFPAAWRAIRELPLQLCLFLTLLFLVLFVSQDDIGGDAHSPSVRQCRMRFKRMVRVPLSVERASGPLR